MTKGFYQSLEYKEKQRKEKIGNKNPMWKGGISRTFYRDQYQPLAKQLYSICQICNTREKLCIHHIDEDFKNNDLENIMVVCRGCHNKIHKKAGGFL